MSRVNVLDFLATSRPVGGHGGGGGGSNDNRGQRRPTEVGPPVMRTAVGPAALIQPPMLRFMSTPAARPPTLPMTPLHRTTTVSTPRTPASGSSFTTPRLLRHLSTIDGAQDLAVQPLTPLVSPSTPLAATKAMLWNVSQDEHYKSAQLVNRPPPPLTHAFNSRALDALCVWPQLTTDNLESFCRPKLDATFAVPGLELRANQPLHCVARRERTSATGAVAFRLVPSTTTQPTVPAPASGAAVKSAGVAPEEEAPADLIVCEYTEQRIAHLQNHMVSSFTEYQRVATRNLLRAAVPSLATAAAAPLSLTRTPQGSARSRLASPGLHHPSPTPGRRGGGDGKEAASPFQHPCVSRLVTLDAQEVGPLMVHLSSNGQNSDIVVLENDLFAAPVVFHDSASALRPASNNTLGDVPTALPETKPRIIGEGQAAPIGGDDEDEECELVLLLTLTQTPAAGSEPHCSATQAKRARRDRDGLADSNGEPPPLRFQFPGVSNGQYAALEDDHPYTLRCRVQQIRSIAAVGQLEPKQPTPKPRSKEGKELLAKVVQFHLCRLIRRKIDYRSWRHQCRAHAEAEEKRRLYATVRGAREADRLASEAAKFEGGVPDNRLRPRRVSSERPSKVDLAPLYYHGAKRSQIRATLDHEDERERRRQRQQFDEQRRADEIWITEQELLDVIPRERERAVVQRVFNTCGLFDELPPGSSANQRRRRRWNEDTVALLDAERACTVEDMCTYFTMEEAWVRMLRAGLHCPSDPNTVETTVQRFRDPTATAYGYYVLYHLADTPWHRADSYRAFLLSKGRIRMHGQGNPLPPGYGYSFVSVRLRARGRKQRTAKRQRRQQRTTAQRVRVDQDSEDEDSECERLDTCHEMAEPTKKHKTKADLRKYHLDKLKDFLGELDADLSAYKLKRWAQCREIARLADLRFERGETLSDILMGFIRCFRLSAKQLEQQDHKTVRDIFALQMRLLRGECPALWTATRVRVDDPLSEAFVHHILHPKRREMSNEEKARRAELEYRRAQRALRAVQDMAVAPTAAPAPAAAASVERSLAPPTVAPEVQTAKPKEESSSDYSSSSDDSSSDDDDY